jgi:hypothetical protein
MGCFLPELMGHFARDGANPMSTVWYCKIGGQELGPMTDQQLRAMAAAGQIARHELVRQGPAGQWMPAGRLQGLFQQATPVQNPPAAPIQQPVIQTPVQNPPAAPIQQPVIQTPVQNQPAAPIQQPGYQTPVQGRPAAPIQQPGIPTAIPTQAPAGPVVETTPRRSSSHRRRGGRQTNQTQGMALGVAALLLAGLGIGLFWVPYVPFPLALIALVLGGIGYATSRGNAQVLSATGCFAGLIALVAGAYGTIGLNGGSSDTQNQTTVKISKQDPASANTQNRTPDVTTWFRRNGHFKDIGVKVSISGVSVDGPSYAPRSTPRAIPATRPAATPKRTNPGGDEAIPIPGLEDEPDAKPPAEVAPVVPDKKKAEPGDDKPNKKPAVEEPVEKPAGIQPDTKKTEKTKLLAATQTYQLDAVCKNPDGDENFVPGVSGGTTIHKPIHTPARPAPARAPAGRRRTSPSRLTVRLRIEKTPGTTSKLEPLLFAGWSTATARQNGQTAYMIDSTGQVHELVATRDTAVKLDIGDVVEHRLVFAKPDVSAEFIRIVLPQSVLGKQGDLGFQIPVTNIQGWGAARPAAVAAPVVRDTRDQPPEDVQRGLGAFEVPGQPAGGAKPIAKKPKPQTKKPQTKKKEPKIGEGNPDLVP